MYVGANRKTPIYNNGLATTVPTNQAGHQMHHTTTCVHKPETVHPNAASSNISLTSTPHQLQPAKATTGGDSKCSKTLAKTFLDFILLPPEGAYGAKVGEESAMCGVPRKDRGVEKRPTRRASEKLRVERVARNMPRRRREMHFARRRWWGERRVEWEISSARREGRRRLVRVKAWSVGWSVWWLWKYGG